MIANNPSASKQTEDLNALQVKEYKLNNGLTVWLNEDHSQPKVFGAVVVKAGAKDCPNTGIAHYFEHMMFKGTEQIGTLNFEAEKEYLDAIAEKYDELAKTDDDFERARLQQEINELNIKSAEYIIPNEFNRLITRYGGTGLNAMTSYDSTIYYNTFSPQYIAQWAEINSERLINPVFRLFQSELETVYEEKSMHGDLIGGPVMDNLLARYFGDHPYAYPIIGSTQHLKNPRLTEMRKFFDDYYVAPNMGLILSGDFDPEKMMEILENTFSRIRSGHIPANEPSQLAPFNGKEEVKIKFPVPFVRGMALGFRGVEANHEDQVALNIAVNLLNNANGTGFLDKLMVEHKVMAALAINQNMNEAGILAVAIIPKLLIQSYGAAEKLAWEAINRVKEGDFSDEVFNSLKLEQKRQYAAALESIDSRATVMMNLFSQNRDWDAYLEELSRIESITKADVMEVARRYFNANYLYVTKSTGNYPKDNLPKPDLEPVVPKYSDAASQYARSLENLPLQQMKARFIDFDHDVTIHQLSPLVTFYATPNPLNDIFTLNLSFKTGYLEQPKVSLLVSYLQFLGTESMPFDVFRSQLQSLGSTITFDVAPDYFHIKVSGFDNYMQQTLTLIRDFMLHVKPDDKKIKQLIDEAKITQKAFFKSNDNLASALVEKVKYGDQSRYLRRPSLGDIRKMKGKELIHLFKTTMQYACDIHYCGTLPVDTMTGYIRHYIPIAKIKKLSPAPFYRELIGYDEPTVFFIAMPDASQSIIYSYIKGDPVSDLPSRYKALMFSIYFGGGMSSLLFQEIREFRSLAYRTNGRYQLAPYCMPDKPGYFTTMLSTQSDKTTDALTVLDELIRNMPEKPARIEAVKQFLINKVHNDYPAFRNISQKVASLRLDGFDHDPGEDFLQSLEAFSMADVEQFYLQHVHNRPVTYVVSGNPKRIDMKKLAAFGKIIKVKKNEICK